MGAAGDRHDFRDDFGGNAEFFQNRLQMAGDGGEMGQELMASLDKAVQKYAAEDDN